MDRTKRSISSDLTNFVLLVPQRNSLDLSTWSHKQERMEGVSLGEKNPIFYHRTTKGLQDLIY